MTSWQCITNCAWLMLSAKILPMTAPIPSGGNLCCSTIIATSLCFFKWDVGHLTVRIGYWSYSAGVIEVISTYKAIV